MGGVAPEYSIGVRAPGGAWEQLGAGALSDVIPENIVHTHGPRGPETLSFQLKRDSRIFLPDELPFTEVAAMVGGVPAWSGRLMRTPRSRGLESVINPVAEGWFLSHLQDYPIDREWVITDLARWRDLRTTSLARLTASEDAQHFRVESGTDGEIMLGIASGSVITSGSRCGVVLDLGPNNTCKTISIDWKSSNNAGTSSRLYAIGDNSGYWVTAPQQTVSGPLNNAGASGTFTATFTTTYRYITILHNMQASFTASSDFWFKIVEARVFTDSADQSSGASVLKASTVITESLAEAPQVSTDTSLVTATSFSIPSYGTHGRRAIGDICNDVNAYHQYQFYGTNEPTPRPVFRPIPTTPTWIITEDKGYEYDDAGANEGAEIYDTVIMQYQDAAGVPAEYIASSSSTILARVGYSRAKVLQARHPMTAAAAQQIADAYLAAYSSSPFKGKVGIKGTITRYADGAEIPVGLITFGDAVVLSSEIEPENGAAGRIGIIQKVAYRHDELRAELELDSTRNYMDAVLERLAIVSR